MSDQPKTAVGKLLAHLLAGESVSDLNANRFGSESMPATIKKFEELQLVFNSKTETHKSADNVEFTLVEYTLAPESIERAEYYLAHAEREIINGINLKPRQAA